MTQTLELEVSCSRCDAVAQRTYTAKAKGGGVRLAVETRCSRCGLAESYDGEGLPEHVRELFEKDAGQWGVRIVSPGKHVGAVARVLRERLGVDTRRVLELLRGEAAVRSGARIEAEAAGELLTEFGATVDIVRSS